MLEIVDDEIELLGQTSFHTRKRLERMEKLEKSKKRKRR